VDIKEDENGFVVYADIPGVDPGAIEIEMDANTLTIKGERKTEQEIKSKNYYRVECASGKFFRQFTLPESIDATKITAKNKRGVLTIHVPKAKAEKNARKIVVEDADS
jgi:HSP20 family protein